MRNRLSVLTALILLSTVVTNTVTMEPPNTKASTVQMDKTESAMATPPIASDLFRKMWEYSDKLVDEIPGAGRGYTWGPNSFGEFTELYQEAPGGRRQVQYFDKSRMELSPNGQYVTNGLLTKELVSGLRQEGDATFTPLTPSTAQVAGDDNSEGGNAIAPSYASFKGVVTFNPGENRAENRINQLANLSIEKAGKVSTLGSTPAQLVLSFYDQTLGHNVPKVFVDYQNLQGRIWNGSDYVNGRVYTDNPTANVFGLPISEPYWIRAVVGGQEKDVLAQLFERRVLTYTPSNDDPFKVEMGNIGQHYYLWRYGKPAQLALKITGANNDIREAIPATQEILSRGGLATAELGKVYTEAIAPTASGYMLPYEVMNLALDTKNRATAGRITLAELGEMLKQIGWVFPSNGTPGEQLIQFFSTWITLAQANPAEPRNFNPLVLAELTKKQVPSVDLASGKARPEEVRFTYLELLLFAASFERAMPKYFNTKNVNSGSNDKEFNNLAEPLKPCSKLKGSFGKDIEQVIDQGADKLLGDKALEEAVKKIGMSELDVKKITTFTKYMQMLTRLFKMALIYFVDIDLQIEGAKTVHKPFQNFLPKNFNLTVAINKEVLDRLQTQITN